MKRQACIAIGINHYQLFQPLSYAQQDAQALRDFLVGEVGLAPDRCLLLSETSPAVNGHSTYPSRDNIQEWLDRFTQQLAPGDILWYFWCGYGVSWEGQDYLMPIEGDPNNVPETGIPTKTILKTFSSAPFETALVLLDMNRATSVRDEEAIGADTIALAQQLEIPTILSCRQGQFSRESNSLSHGLFAAALLEALRYHRCITVEHLDRYLSQRLPQLSEHLWLPVQEPLTVIHPPGKIHQLIWQSKVNGTVDRALSLSPTNGNGKQPQAQVIPMKPYPVSVNGSKNGKARAENLGLTCDMELIAVSKKPVNRKLELVEESVRTSENLEMDNIAVEKKRIAKNKGGLNHKNSPIAERLSKFASLAANADKSGRSQQVAMWSGAAALVLVLGIFVSRSANSWRQPSEAEPIATASDAQPPRAIESPTASLSSQTPSEGKATENPPETQSRGQSQIELDRALLALQPTDVSKFGYAIAIARKIPPADPLYEEAQQNIDRWSEVIADISRGRAKQGNFSGAIAAAKLVPSDRIKLHVKMQQSIEQWQEQLQQQQANDKIIKTATASTRKKQAESYARAIASVRQISPSQPKYTEAQQLIAQWSQAILNIAKLRAARGKLSLAIEVAKSVPPETPAYPDAQKAIALWKSQLPRR